MNKGSRIAAAAIGTTFIALDLFPLVRFSRNLADSDGKVARLLYDAHDAATLLDNPAVKNNNIVRDILAADTFGYLQAAKIYRPDVPVDPYMQRLETTLQPSQNFDLHLRDLAYKYDPSINQIKTGLSSLLVVAGLVLLSMAAKDTVVNAYQRLRSRTSTARQSSS